MRRYQKAWIALALFAPATALGCNAVFGLDEAAIDPTFGADGSVSEGDGGRADDGGTRGGDAAKDVVADDVIVVVPPDGAPPLDVSCTNYCGLMAQYCMGDNAQYYNVDECLKYCGAMDQGVQGQTSADSVACRQHYAVLAAQGVEPHTNCLAGGAVGGGVCGPDACDTWCERLTRICEAKSYPDKPTCVSACQTWPYLLDVTLANADTFDTLNCRDYHLQAVFQVDAAAPDYSHCTHVKFSCYKDAGVAIDSGAATDAGAD